MAGKRRGRGGKRKAGRKQNEECNQDPQSHGRVDTVAQSNGQTSSAKSNGHAQVYDPPGDYEDRGHQQACIQYYSDDEEIDDTSNAYQRQQIHRANGQYVGDDYDERAPNYSYSYSSEEPDKNEPHHRTREPPSRAWQEEEEEQYDELQTEMAHRQQRQHEEQQYNHDDHAFTQFNIKPLHPTQQRSVPEDGSESDEDEEAPFFTPSNNFNFATDNYSEAHVKGVGWGVDYLQARANRKEQERREQFEIEQRRKREHESRWCSWCRSEDEWDDVDFDNYHSSASFKCKRRMKQMLVVAIAFTAALAFHARGEVVRGGNASSENGDAPEKPTYHGSVPSSRWGHRFDDDDAALGDAGDDSIEILGDDISGTATYHKHGHNSHHAQLTPEEQAEEAEKWEDYEMEVANVLADTKPGWDIHSKAGGLEKEEAKVKKDGFRDHWIQYYDKTSQWYYYFHRETNTTQWEKPEVGSGVVLLGIAYGTGREYVIEEGDAVNDDDESAEELDDEEEDDEIDSLGALLDFDDDEETDFDAQEVLDRYHESYWRWNHPYRIPERTDVWGGIDTPVFWRVPLSGATTVEEIFTHCYDMIVAGTTGKTKDGKAVLKRNITEHLSVLTLDDGAHYLNIDMNRVEGIQAAKKAGLGTAHVADVILTRHLYNAAELFKDTGHTGRCFTILRHPVERAQAMYYSLKRARAKAVENMSLEAYANSTIAEDNWMTRMLTGTMEKKLTRRHLEVAKEVLGRKCLVGFVDTFTESMERFVKFFRFEHVKSVNKHHTVGSTSEEDGIEAKRKCADKLMKTGVNRHEYPKLSQDSDAWRALYRKNILDMQLYKLALEQFHKQKVVYQIKGDESARHL